MGKKRFAWVVAAAGSLSLAACSAGGDSAHTGQLRSPEQVKECLQGRGLQVTGPGEPATDDRDAPDRGELITSGAFIAFYSSADVATSSADAIQREAARLNASVTRDGDVTVVYLVKNDAKEPVEACLAE